MKQPDNKTLERAIQTMHILGSDAHPDAALAQLKEDPLLFVPVTIENADDPARMHLQEKRLPDSWMAAFTSQSAMEAKSSENYSLVPFSALLDAAMEQNECPGIILNNWTDKLVLSRKTLQFVKNWKPQSHIELVQASVLDIPCDAIVNAANSALAGGGGVDGAIHAAAGPELDKACRKLHGCPTGKAKTTDSFAIPTCDKIIHAVGPVYSGTDKDERLLKSAYQTSLDEALKHGCKTIAFCGISTGIYGYPIEEAAEVSLEAIRQWLDRHKDIVMNVYLCAFRPQEYIAYSTLMNQ